MRSNTPLHGLQGDRCFIPIVKGGSYAFIKPTEWYVDWSTAAVREYVKPSPNKARFQNARYYFREGVAVPMVSSRRVTAALLEHRLFDQAVVGVFPREPGLLFYLLGFFNSDVCTRLLRAINPSANNSANYVKRIPVIVPPAPELAYACGIVKEIVAFVRDRGYLPTDRMQHLNHLFAGIYHCEDVGGPSSSAGLRVWPSDALGDDLGSGEMVDPQ